MLKRRVAAVEKRLAGLGGPTGKPCLVFRFGDGTEPPGEKDETQDEKDGLIVFNMPRPGMAEGERVFRFDFGSGEGQAGRVNAKANDVADNSHSAERERTQV